MQLGREMEGKVEGIAEIRFNGMTIDEQARTQSQFLNARPLNLELNEFERNTFKNSLKEEYKKFGQKQVLSPKETVQTMPSTNTVYPENSMAILMTPDQFQMSPLTPLSSTIHLNPWDQKRRASFMSNSPSSFDMNSVTYQNTISKQRPRSNSFSSLVSHDSHRNSFLERNRKAAMKSRLKKKSYLADLEQSVERLSKENRELQELVQDLKNKLRERDGP